MTEPLLADLGGPQSVVLTGIRRSGKTTVMHQMIQGLLDKGVAPERVLYVNLEDLALDGIGLPAIAAAHRQALAPGPPRYLFLDEVQSRPAWSRFVRVLVDQQKDSVAVTGSTSSLLAGEAGALLTGRHKTTHVRPLDYPGFLRFHDVRVPDVPSPQTIDACIHHLDRYLEMGGFPRPNLEDPAASRRTLQHYFTDILERDLVAGQGLDARKVRALGGYVAKTFARPHTKSALQRATGISRDSVRDYLGAMESAYVLSACTRFTWSPKPTEQAPVKYYLADPGLRNAVVSPGRDQGRLAENVVANALEAAGHPLHYWKDHGHEVDFVVPDGDRLNAYQVTYGETVPQREVAALQALWDELPARRRGKWLLLTRGDVELEVPSMALWRWLLEA